MRLPLSSFPTIAFRKNISALLAGRFWFLLGGAIGLLSVALSGCGKSNGQGQPGGAMPAPEVSVITVAPKDVAYGFEYAGQTSGYRETEVRARVSGILERRLYKEGERVKAGTALFQIDPAMYQAQLASAEALAAVAEAKVNQARRELTRLTPLAAEKAISQKELDDAKSSLETAEASLKQTRAQVSEARLNLGYTKVIAPINGVTGIANKSNGSLITATDSLLTTLVQTDPIYVNFSLPEADYLHISKEAAAQRINLPKAREKDGTFGFTVQVKLADGSLYPLTGSMNFLSAKVNPANGGFDARAKIKNPDGILRPGQFVRVLLGGAQRTNALVVPQRAVVDGPMGKMVFVVSQDNKLAPRPVELDGWNKGEWVVTKGLQSGEQVMVEGVIKAHTPGMTVKPVPYNPQSSATSAATPATTSAK